MKDIIKVKNLNKEYKNFSLKNINLDIKENEIVGFIGRNGAGKTTLINCLMNFIDYSCKEYTFDNKKITNDSYDYKSLIGYMGDTISLYPDSTVKQMINFYKSAFSKDWNQESFENNFSLFKIDEGLKIKDLSTGMRIKLFLMLILSRNPRILILDEPTSGLDPVIRNELLNILKEYQLKKKGTIFFSSHITEDIDILADRIIYIDDGRILLNIKKDEIEKRFYKFRYSQELEKSLKGKFVLNDSWCLIDLLNFNKQDLCKLELEACSLLDVYIYLRKEDKNV